MPVSSKRRICLVSYLVAIQDALLITSLQSGTSSDDASAAEDIPFKAPVKKKETMPKSKGKGKGKAKAEPVEDPQDSGSGDEEMEEDEWVKLQVYRWRITLTSHQIRSRAYRQPQIRA